MYFHLDGSEELEVNNGKESEGDEGHPQEVGDEDVVPRIRQVRSQAGGTEPGKHQMEIYWLQKNLWHLGTGIDVAFILPLMLIKVTFIIFTEVEYQYIWGKKKKFKNLVGEARV